MIRQIGVMVRKQRTQAGLSQKMLCRGLCSVSELSKLENEDRKLDSFTLNSLVQRLGKSMNQFEILISEDEYQLILTRAVIQEALQLCRLSEAETALENYKHATESLKKDLHKQYILMVEAVIAYLKNEDAKACFEKVRAAAELSFPEKEKENLIWETGCLCLQEMQVLLLVAYLLQKLEKWKDAEGLLLKMMRCMEERDISEDIKTGIYPKCCYLYSVLCLEQNRQEDAVNAAERGIDCLTRNGCLAFLDKLLEIKLRFREDDEIRSQLEAIEFLKSFQSDTIQENTISELLYLGTPRAVIINSELLKDLRKAQNYSQEELADNICARETLSKIEQGRMANQKKMQQLLERLGVEWEAYYSFVAAEDFETYEMVREYRKGFFTENQEGEEELLEEISKRIDLSIPVNKQFVEVSQIMHARRKGLLKPKEVIDKLTECLRYTMPEYDGMIYRVPYREEIVILNTVAMSLKNLNCFAEALQLYELVLKKCRSSKVVQEHRLPSMMILYLNYSELLEECNYLDRAENYEKEGIALMLKCQRGDFAAMLLGNLSCVFEKQKTQEGKILCEQCSRHAYRLLKLFNFEKDSEIVKEYYDARF